MSAIIRAQAAALAALVDGLSQTFLSGLGKWCPFFAPGRMASHLMTLKRCVPRSLTCRGLKA